MPVEHSHDPADIAARLEEPFKASYLRDYVYGGIDGAVTTFAIVAGVAGADLSIGVVLVLGLANLVGDGFSMAAGNFSGTRLEAEQQRSLRAMEQRHLDHDPDGEREEVRQLFIRKGFDGEALNAAVEVITAERERWVDFMMVEEHGAPPMERKSLPAAFATFIAFIICGAAPLAPYFLDWVGLFTAPTALLFQIAAIVTCAVFFAIGSAQGLFVDKPGWRLGLETLATGASAAAIAYAIGWALKGMVG